VCSSDLVYVRELAASLAQSGVETTVYVRRWDARQPREVVVEPGFRVVHIDAGPPHLAKESLAETVDAFTAGVHDELAERPADVLHANYWLSGVAGHRLKHQLELPLVSTFHTLARVKAETGDPEPQRRIDAEAEVVGCSDVILANSVEEVAQLCKELAPGSTITAVERSRFGNTSTRRNTQDQLYIRNLLNILRANSAQAVWEMENGAIGRWLRDFEARNSARKRKSIPGQIELFEDLSFEDAPTPKCDALTAMLASKPLRDIDRKRYRACAKIQEKKHRVVFQIGRASCRERV